MDVSLTSPTTNTSAATMVLLSFDFYFNNYSTQLDSFYVEVYNGTSWVTRYVRSAVDTGAFSAPAHMVIDVTAEKNAAMQVRFTYTSAWGMFCALDNVVLLEPEANDVGMLSVDFGSSLAGTVTPKATVKNYGTATQTFDVTMTINPGGYTSTQSVTALAGNANQQVNFAPWSATAGNYNVVVYTQLGTDADHINDTLKSDFVIIASMTNKAFAYIAYTTGTGLTNGPVMIDLDAPEIILQIASDAGNFVSGGTWANDKWYGVVYTDNTLITIDTTTGARTVIGSLGKEFSGISYDITTSTMYGVSLTGLYTIDMTTGAATLVADSVVTGSVFINLACSPINGNLYTLDIVTDSLYKLDKTTGAATLIGDIGTDASYAQDAEFSSDGTFYMALYNVSTSPSGMLSTCDTTTAALSGNVLFGNGTDNFEITGFAIPYHTTGIAENDVRFSVFPNPASEFVVVDASADMTLVEIINLNGQVVMSQTIDANHAVLNVKNLTSGTYVMNIITDNGVASKKIQVQ